MVKCRWMPSVERWFDDEQCRQESVAQHVAQCAICGEYLAALHKLRHGAEAAAFPERIEDTQFPAFMDGIRRRLEPAGRRHGGLWAFASVSAAAMIAAVSMFLVFAGRPRDVTATVVEEATTEIEGATVTVEEWYSSDGDTATIWVHVPEKEVW
ncbi:MAG TPA: hypothetical protein HPP77_11565 [Candidatus Hydrogenedentes bacterium]|nr:hypothetical protein [Candidatus Hydrogenedentota bacterium]HIJ74847.1 hypothetical protein [Candidatus Hydrogenedentota bacterium]